MNRILKASLLSSIFAASISFSQSDSAKSSYQRAITFSFSGFNLGGGISGRFWLSNEYCLRLGVNGRYESNISTPPLLDSLDQQTNFKTTQYGFNFGLERHFPVNESLSPYFGLAVGLVHTYRNYKYTYLTYATTWPRSTDTYTGSIFLGVEYWVARNISFAGEQSVSFSYYKNTDYSNLDISNSTSALMVSIYF